MRHEPTAGCPAMLDARLWFPDPEQAVRWGPHAGLVAIGGDLSVPRLLLAYRSGIFPWTDEPLTWWAPDPRGIFELDHLHVARSLRPVLRRGGFTVTRDRAFRQVVEGCAEVATGRATTWISGGFIDAYENLFRAGYAHSVECWREGALVGGVYGVAVGGMFAGESMFHRVSNASKVALVHLHEHLRQRRFAVFDIQMVTPTTEALGARTISRREYLRRLSRAITASVTF